MTINDARDFAKPIRARSREQFRSDLVDAARRLFLRKGVQATSMADLGRELGVSKPTVYEAFESKQALIDAVFHAAALDADLSWLMEDLKSPPPFATLLDHTAESYKNFLNSPRSVEVFQLVIREGVHSNDMLSAFATHLAGPSRAAMRKLVGIAMERGECVEMPLDVAQRMLVAPLYFLMLDRAMFGEGAMSHEAALAYIDHSFAALKSHLCGHQSTVVDVAAPRHTEGKVVAA